MSPGVYSSHSIFLNLLTYYLTWAILENIPCTLEKNVYSAVVGWNVLCMSVRSGWYADQGLHFLTELIINTFLMLKNSYKSVRKALNNKNMDERHTS